MPKQRRMNKQARLELVRSYREEYMSAGWVRRGEILSCLQGSTNYNREYLICQLRGKYKHHALCQLRQSTNLRLLRRQIYAQIDRLFHLPNAAPGITEDVHDTLTFPLSSWKGGGSLK